jgi:hypothetical protein
MAGNSHGLSDNLPNVFQRLSEIDADLPTDFVKFANDNALASKL